MNRQGIQQFVVNLDGQHSFQRIKLFIRVIMPMPGVLWPITPLSAQPRESGFRSDRVFVPAECHRFKSAVQLSTTVVGIVILSSGAEATRNRWPSAATTK